MSIIDAGARGLASVFMWPTIGLVVLGVIIGIVVGLLPGLGGGVALALMLPFTFAMTPMNAFAFLLAMVSVCATAGDITSILFGVPGESVSAALVLDGHAMAKRGEAGRALGASLTSAGLGAVFGAVAFVAIIPVVRPVVLALGAPEFLMLSLLGITFVAALSGNAVLSGILTGALGLMLSTVGMDARLGFGRFTFGIESLFDGLGLVPIAIGLFAIPELVELAESGTSIGGGAVGALGGVMQGVKDAFRHISLNVRCSVLGVFTGIMPGMGGAVGQWLAYAYAAQNSKEKEKFGHGAIEGVIAPSSATNSKEGGNLLTAVAFGVPTSVSMAILIGGFMIQGIQPGPQMLTTYLDLTLSMAWVLVIATVITLGILALFLRPLATLTFIRSSLMIPTIILLLFVGTFAEKYQLSDVVVMLAFGLLGVIMDRLQWSRPPLMLGIVLGEIAESNLFLSVSRYDMGWMERPGVLMIAVLIVGVVLLPFVKGMLRRVRGETSSVPVKKSLLGRQARTAEVVLAGITLLLTVAAVWQASAWGIGASLFPSVVGYTLIGLLVARMTVSIMEIKREPWGKGGEAVSFIDVFKQEKARRALTVSAWTCGFLALIWILGFIVGGVVGMVAYLVAARERWPMVLGLSGGAAIVMWVLDVWLYLPFCGGLLLPNPLG